MTRDPHEFDSMPNPADCKRVWELSNSLQYTYNSLTDKKRQDLDAQMSAIPTGHGELKILDSRFTSGEPGAIEWIKFEVELQFPQSGSR